MRIEWSNCARDDLDDLARFISRDSPFYARNFTSRVVLSTRRLRDFPESGRLIPEIEDSNLRELIVHGYRVIYRLEADRLLILAVMHGSRHLDPANLPPWSRID